ncbi:MAG: M23 family metallopeptidase [Roseibium sp.]|nr:M23 family metallopeptidase [Roseibium sp.]
MLNRAAFPMPFIERKHALAAAFASLFAVTLITGCYAVYVIMRDDMVAVADAEKTELELLYQDRIDRLRAEIERLNSRQIVDRESVELQVHELIRRQQTIAKQHAMVEALVDRAEQSGIQIITGRPVPPQKPVRAPSTAAVAPPDHLLAIGGESEPLKDPIKALGLRGSATDTPIEPGLGEPLATDEHAVLDNVKNSLRMMDQRSNAALDAIAVATEGQIATILASMRPLGVSLATAAGPGTATGGPFVPVTGQSFAHRVGRAAHALDALEDLKFAAGRLPIGRPVLSARISSEYGPRLDPFLKRWAMHSGIDFKGQYGARVYSAAPGTVSHAGWKGGYGKMVEIRHANGHLTRYAHLSRLQVAEGDHVLAGDVIGNIGSTGRSTGPHLHYEVRTENGSVDPAGYVAAGDRLAQILGR